MAAMKRTLRYSKPLPSTWTLIGAIAAGLLFLVCTAQLARGPGDADVWRFVAVASLYAFFCLSTRRRDAVHAGTAVARRRSAHR